ncbi:MAG: lipase family protein [Moraxellaceae bacterium]|nr:lipase family protein [Moraxellaceae bacterium]
MSMYRVIYLFLASIFIMPSLAGCNSSSAKETSPEVIEEPTQVGTPHVFIPSTTVRGWRNKDPGTVIEVQNAPPLSQIEGSSHALFVRYTTTNLNGEPVLASGLVLFPTNKTFKDGELPLVVYGHMTTGAADACAPSRSSPDSTELQKMQQGDEIARQLLKEGVVVARPDYEGLGESGPHPYLRGDSLARSMRDMASAVTSYWGEIGDSWIAAGHSEGAVAALNAGSRKHPEARNTKLIGVVAITPVTQIEKLVFLGEQIPLSGYPINELVALTALILSGIASEDPSFKKLILEDGGLSPQAVKLWPDIERYCLADLGQKSSWGGLSPWDLKGPRGSEASAELKRALRADDVQHLPMRTEVPIRIDAGILDAVALLPFTEQLVQTYRNNGYSVTFDRWLAGHSPTADMAAPAITRWIMERFQE